MARLPRFALPGQAQHVIQRGNNRALIFADDADYRFYLKKLRTRNGTNANGSTWKGPCFLPRVIDGRFA